MDSVAHPILLHVGIFPNARQVGWSKEELWGKSITHYKGSDLFRQGRRRWGEGVHGTGPPVGWPFKDPMVRSTDPYL